MELTEIQNFYKNKTIFITGATGFIGKVLVEKLLRSCSELNKIILTIRPKKKESAEDRISEYFKDTIFDTIRNKINIRSKTIFLITNLEDKHFGLNDTNYEYVKSSVNIIFHCAATVEFTAPLKEAIICNIRITKNVIEVAKNMDNLQAFVYVSTCWVQGILDYTKESVVKLSHDPEYFLNLVDTHTNEEILSITPSLMENWPNTYLLTKNVTEYQIEREKENLPLTIFRAPGVTPTYREPIPGWMNAMQAIIMGSIGLARGVIKVMRADLEYNMHIVPADMVANGMIAVAWNTALQNGNKEFKVYTYSSVTNPLIRKKLCDYVTNTPYPLEYTIWTPGYVAASNKWLLDKYIFFYHTLPAAITDIFLKLLGQKPIFKKIMDRANKMVAVTEFFMTTDYKFEFNNIPALWNLLEPDDQKLFNFDVNSINWDEYLNLFAKSMKLQLKEDFNNIDKCEAQRYLLRCKY